MPVECLAKLRELDAKLTLEFKQASRSRMVGDWFFSMPWPAWIKDLSGRVIAMNPAYFQQYGISEADYVGSFDGGWPECTRRDFGDNDTEVATTGRAATYIERITNPKTGRHENLLVLKFPVIDAGNVVGVGGFAVYIPT